MRASKTLGLPGPLTRSLNPGRKGIRASRSGCALRAHNLLRPLYLKILGSAPKKRLGESPEEVNELPVCDIQASVCVFFSE